MLTRLTPALRSAGLLTAARTAPSVHVCGPSCSHALHTAAAPEAPSCGHAPGHCTHRCHLSTRSQTKGNRGVTYVKPGA